jgi:hypothetical protein
MICNLSFPLNFLPGRRTWLRRGTSNLDLLVALSLLVTVMSVSSPLVVRHGRLLSSHRNYRLALDELSNQLDRLRAMPIAELAREIERLAPSSFVVERLPGARLTGQLRPEELGTQITLSLSWNDAERHGAPVTLATWVFPDASQVESVTIEAEPL